MDPVTDHALTAFEQYGLAGFTAALLGLLVWGTKAFVSYVKSNSENLVKMSERHILATSKNTEVMEQLGQSIERQSGELKDTNNLIRSRPCIAKDTA